MTIYFVFGSNLGGRHGAGSALEALQKWDAIYGVGRGPQGRSYAIPTKDGRFLPRPLDAIRVDVEAFIVFAKKHPEHRFRVCKIGCGLAGFKEDEISPMFRDAPENCQLPEGWRVLPESPG